MNKMVKLLSLVLGFLFTAWVLPVKADAVSMLVYHHQSEGVLGPDAYYQSYFKEYSSPEWVNFIPAVSGTVKVYSVQDLCTHYWPSYYNAPCLFQRSITLVNEVSIGGSGPAYLNLTPKLSGQVSYAGQTVTTKRDYYHEYYVLRFTLSSAYSGQSPPAPMPDFGSSSIKGTAWLEFVTNDWDSSNYSQLVQIMAGTKTFDVVVVVSEHQSSASVVSQWSANETPMNIANYIGANGQNPAPMQMSVGIWP